MTLCNHVGWMVCKQMQFERLTYNLDPLQRPDFLSIYTKLNSYLTEAYQKIPRIVTEPHTSSEDNVTYPEYAASPNEL
jgi:hypothetical protein